MEKVYILDDNKTFATALSRFLIEKGYEVRSFQKPDEALQTIKMQVPDYLLLDLKLPEISGINVLKKVSEIAPDVITIIMTAYGSIESAVEAIKMGAFHYLTKPFEYEEVHILLGKAKETKALKRENIYLRETLKEKEEEISIIGETHLFKQALSLAEKVAEQDTTVLLVGESGTGKELFARKIHFSSKRKSGPFIPINCAAIPRELLENELFGSEKGAYTGSVATKIGKFELANKGTLFLDEIGELHLDLQAKILRAIERKEIERLGGTKPISVDVRIIAATNKELRQLVEEKKFREDLYFRIAIFPIYLPPLKARKADIPILVEHFLSKFRKKFNKPELRATQEIIDAFMEYNWPGNIRELENVVERACILSDGKRITLEHTTLPFYGKPNIEDIVDSLSGLSLRKAQKLAIEKIEEYIILKVYEETKGNKALMVEKLGISRRTLYNKLKKYGVE